MGRATRWFKGLFSLKKSKERQSRVSGDHSDNGGDFNLPTDPVWCRTFLTDTEKEQNKHAIVVANATATAAVAAVSASKAAAAVVRLTGDRRAGDIITRKERWAAVKIQKVFRGFLARKALRALKGIVKLQALVRGYLVRKRAAAMLQRIQALIRVQTVMRSKRINRCLNKEYNNMFQPRQSLVKFDEAACDERSPKNVEKEDTYKRRTSSRPKLRQVHNVVTVSEYDDDFVYKRNDLEMEKWKFATAQNTPRLSSASYHHLANNHYYVTQSPARTAVCGNALCDYGMTTPGYMEKTQSFKAKQRSHSAPRQRSERKRLSVDDVVMSRSSVCGVTMEQQQRYSCSYDPL